MTETLNHLEFDRLEDGTLVALASHAGRSVAAIVHPVHSSGGGERRWSLAGDLMDAQDRPSGAADMARTACAEAVEALGVELRIPASSWSCRA